MLLKFDESLGQSYKSNSQKIRVMSETWIKNNMFCPCCGGVKLKKFENNKPVADFYCENCSEEFELKSKSGNLGKKIVDGAYETAIKRITGFNNPNLFILQYQSYEIINLLVVPNFYFVPDVIEKRKPLGENARRAGWVGSNILFEKIPTNGKIKIINDRLLRDPKDVLDDYAKSRKLQIKNIEDRGWLIDILNLVNIQNEFFELNDIYKYKNQLQILHPKNHNIEAKIRQQLQFLRDKNLLLFLGNGKYRRL